jgi:hypothetical protein
MHRGHLGQLDRAPRRIVREPASPSRVRAAVRAGAPPPPPPPPRAPPRAPPHHRTIMHSVPAHEYACQACGRRG